MAWIAAFDAEHLASVDAHAAMFSAFVTEHRGHRGKAGGFAQQAQGEAQIL